jgi:hypothetical protein
MKRSTMKFQCRKCCDEFQEDPCTLDIPNDPHHTIKEVMVGLTMCPLEGCDYKKGKWIKNGETYKAEWKRA